MRKTAHCLAIAAALSSAFAPAADAADAYGFPGTREERSGAFIGAYARIPLGESRAEPQSGPQAGPQVGPQVGLTLAMTRQALDPTDAGRLQRFRADAVTLGFSGSDFREAAPPTLSLAGMRVAGGPDRLNADGTKAEEDDGFPWLYAAGGTLLVAGLVGAGVFYYLVAESKKNSD
ncbi:MAG TPA: hypothetical protein VED40_04990 [Azospirillaceae bacterium]|nr:hypothetical protein [Azospirillaceae bacterium]